jgi:Mrp family chromosome partitioning ATPase
VDSLVELDRSRSDFGAAGGVDPIFVALTTRAAELGKELEGIARARRASLRAELDRMRPARPPRPTPLPAIDTIPLVAARDSAEGELARMDRLLARARAVHRELDLETAREREEAAKGASPLAMLAAALVLGLALGYAVALVGEMRRPRVGDAREATLIADAPLLARIRAHSGLPERMRRRADRELSPLIDLASGSYDVLHKELSAGGVNVSLVAVVSDHAGVAATVSTNLAAAAAHAARATLVVDMDFETHAVSAILRTRRSPGLSDLLARRIDWPEALRSAMVGRDRSVDVLPSGRSAPRGTLQSAAGELAGELARLVSRYELVIVSAPHSRFGVVPAVASAVPTVVLCVRSGRTGVSALEQLVRAVTQHGATVRGIVVWETDDPVPTALSEADRAAGREKPLHPQTTELPVPGSSA